MSEYLQLINPKEAFQSSKGQKSCLIDVRTPGEFSTVHAVGAVNLPLDKITNDTLKELTANENQPIYFICQGGTRSKAAAEKALQMGFKDVFSIEGGTSLWEKLGLPVKNSQSAVISLERQVRIAAGALVFLGTIAGLIIHPIFYIIPLFVGGGLVFAGVTDTCGMSMCLARLPWNKGQSSSC